MAGIQIRNDLEKDYKDIYSPEVLKALLSLSPFNKDQKALMQKRIEIRTRRAASKEKIDFLFPHYYLSSVPKNSGMVG